MADVKKIATRVSYGEALVELANEHDDFVVLDADLAAATQTDPVCCTVSSPRPNQTVDPYRARYSYRPGAGRR